MLGSQQLHIPEECTSDLHMPTLKMEACKKGESKVSLTGRLKKKIQLELHFKARHGPVVPAGHPSL